MSTLETQVAIAEAQAATLARVLDETLDELHLGIFKKRAKKILARKLRDAAES